jgi:hypothetical protein
MKKVTLETTEKVRQEAFYESSLRWLPHEISTGECWFQKEGMNRCLN